MQAAIDAPWGHDFAIVMDRDGARLEQTIDLLDAGATTMEARTTRIADRLVALDQYRIIVLDVFDRGRREQRPPGMAVEAIALGRPGTPPNSSSISWKYLPFLSVPEKMKCGLVP